MAEFPGSGEVMIGVALFVVAIVAGAINSVAGGGGLLTFPLLMTVVSPVTADATSGFALLPAYGTSTWGCRHDLAKVRHWLWLLLAPSLLGGFVGAWLLGWGGNRDFLPLVPWLVLLSTALILVKPLLGLRQAPEDPDGPEPPLPGPAGCTVAVVLLFLVGVYGGFFGGGLGILAIGALGLLGLGNLHRIVTLKNALSGGLRSVAVLLLLIEGKVDLGYGLLMACGGLLGGLVGAKVLRRTNPAVVRAFVLTLGFTIAAWYFWQVYGAGLLGGEHPATQGGSGGPRPGHLALLGQRTPGEKVRYSPGWDLGLKSGPGPSRGGWEKTATPRAPAATFASLNTAPASLSALEDP